jgi:uncharacterized protein (TIGR02284 family)
MTVDDLSVLQTAAIDARSGYVEALKDVEGDDITTLFQQMIATHTENAEELRTEIVKRGVAVDEEGSFMGAVHRSIMSIRSLFGGLVASILPSLIDGKERHANAV